MSRSVFFLLVLAALLAGGPALAETVTFQVRMGYQMELGAFDPATDFVDVAGSWNNWGQDPLTMLADADGDSIYEVSSDGFQVGEIIEFKFRINGQWDGSEEFPGGGGNRTHTVEWGTNTILVWYGDLAPLQPDPSQLGWWNDEVFYEIFVRSFQDSDGDGIGDLAGLTQRLDYLNDGDPGTDTDLGITGIWLMPINDSPSYHGYDATDYRAINPDYGTMEDFRTFLDEAHARGIKVIVDYVMNHCSTQHPWFQASAAQDPAFGDWFRWSATQPEQGGWHWDPSGWYYGLFWSGMPDLNYQTPAVQTEMFDTATWWLQNVGVDGFRLDAVLYIHENGNEVANTQATLDFWHDFNTHIKATHPAALTVGEAWTNSATVREYVTEDRLDICFEFDLAYAIIDGVNTGNLSYPRAKAQEVLGLYPYQQYATFLTNHDQDRLFTRLEENAGRNAAAAGIYLSLPGVPFLYYGEEIGITGAGDHRNIRTPMQWDNSPLAGFSTGTPWQPINNNAATHNVATMRQDDSSLWTRYRNMVQARAGNPALQRGEMILLEEEAPEVMAFLRRVEGETVLCLINAGGWGVSGLAVSGPAADLPAGEYLLTNLLDPTDAPTITVNAAHTIEDLTLEPYEVAWYRLDGTSSAPVPMRTGLNLRGHPNPFNPTTTLRFRLAEPARARLSIHDAAGRRIRTFESDQLLAGEHSFVWNGTDEMGLPVASGVFLARLVVSGAEASTKILMLK